MWQCLLDYNMDEEQAQRQVQQMCNFILNEAKDKAQEIEAQALEDFNIEKLKLVQQMKDKIRQEYQKKAKQIEVERSTARSAAINRARLQKISARQQVIEEVIEQTQENLNTISHDRASYSQLLVDIIAQGLLQLLEPKVLVVCREVDKDIVESCLPKAAAKFADILQSDVGVKKTVDVSIDKRRFLPPPPSADIPSGGGRSCCGGVRLMTPDGRIVCDNTLDARLKLVVKNCAPEIRSTLFPKNI
eukprot:GHVQ01025954.1.p1 GENE.GHVQ01025954.1~~GHVQ01025954.1.p1  ORF type:complete len:246 (-),score=49.15 GHVQ01025954.1:1686-2423(-)